MIIFVNVRSCQNYFRKFLKNHKENYKAVSLLPHVSKIFERSNNQLHGRQTSSFYNWFQEITSDTKLFGSDVRKMEKGT